VIDTEPAVWLLAPDDTVTAPDEDAVDELVVVPEPTLTAPVARLPATEFADFIDTAPVAATSDAPPVMLTAPPFPSNESPALRVISFPSPLSLLPTATLMVPPRPLEEAPVLIDTPPDVPALAPVAIEIAPDEDTASSDVAVVVPVEIVIAPEA
jgi:hypothetical protein